VQFYPENRIFQNTILHPKILHVAQNGQVLLAHTPKGMGVPPTIFFQWGVKNWLKFCVWATRTLALRGLAQWNFMTWCAAGWGHRPLKIWKAKNVQNSARFGTTSNFDCKYLWKVLTYRQAVNGVINYCFFCVKEKKMVNFGPLTKKLCLLISTYPTLTVSTFSDNFRIWSHISRERIEISMNGKWRLQPQSIPCWIQKNLWTLVRKQQSSLVSFGTTKV